MLAKPLDVQPALAKGDKMPVEDWRIKTIKQLGVPTAFLVAILYLGYRGVEWFGVSILTPLFQRQMSFMDSLERSVTTIDATLNDYSTINAKLLSDQVLTHQAVLENRTINQDTNGILKEYVKERTEQNRAILEVLDKIEKNIKK